MTRNLTESVTYLPDFFEVICFFPRATGKKPWSRINLDWFCPVSGALDALISPGHDNHTRARLES